MRVGCLLAPQASPALSSPRQSSPQIPGPLAAPLVRSPDRDLTTRSDGHWVSAGSMRVARANPMVIQLRGGRVLVAGGEDREGGVLGSAEIYHPKDRRAGPTPADSNQPRMTAAVSLLRSGRVLVAGGQGRGRILHSAEIYNPATGRWRLTDPMDRAREGAGISLLPHGRVLVAGGAGGSRAWRSAEIYRPSTERWHAADQMDVARAGGWSPMPAVRLRGGDVLMAGGGVDITATAQRFDVATRSWQDAESLASAPARRPLSPFPVGGLLPLLRAVQPPASTG